MNKILLGIFILMLFAMPMFATGDISNWWNDDWNSRVKYTTTINWYNGSASSMTDYQVPLDIDLDQTVATAANLRFVYLNTTSNLSTQLSHWCEDTFASATMSGRCWVKMPYVKNNTAFVVYAYYNASGKSSTNSIRAVSDFSKQGDDFNDGSINTTLWSSAGSETLNSGYWTYTGANMYSVKNPLNSSYWTCVSGRMEFNNTGNKYYGNRHTSPSVRSVMWQSATGTLALGNYDGTVSDVAISGYSQNTLYNLDVCRTGSAGRTYLYWGSSLPTLKYTNPTHAPTETALGLVVGGDKVDWVFVRKWQPNTQSVSTSTADVIVPYVLLQSHFPTNITTTNLFTQPNQSANFTYNATSSISPSVKRIITLTFAVNSTTRGWNLFFSNGTNEFPSEFTGLPADMNATYGSSILFTWLPGENYIYPHTEMYDMEIMSTKQHLPYILSNPNQLIKSMFINLSTSTQYNFFEANIHNNTPTASPMRIYYCNSSYTSGNIDASNKCYQFGQISPTTNYNHTHVNASNTSQQVTYHYIFPFRIVGGYVGTVKATSTAYIIYRGSNIGTWDVTYVPVKAGRLKTTQTSANKGSTWTEQDTMVTDAHIHQYDGTEKIWFKGCDQLGNCTSYHTEIIDEDPIAPTNVNFIQPNVTTFMYSDTSGLLNITWTPAVAGSGSDINYSLALTKSANCTIIPGDLILMTNTKPTSYMLNYTSIAPYWNYYLCVNAYDSTTGLESNSASEPFALFYVNATMTLSPVTPAIYQNLTVNISSSTNFSYFNALPSPYWLEYRYEWTNLSNATGYNFTVTNYSPRAWGTKIYIEPTMGVNLSLVVAYIGIVPSPEGYSVPEENRTGSLPYFYNFSIINTSILTNCTTGINFLVYNWNGDTVINADQAHNISVDLGVTTISRVINETNVSNVKVCVEPAGIYQLNDQIYYSQNASLGYLRSFITNGVYNFNYNYTHNLFWLYSPYTIKVKVINQESNTPVPNVIVSMVKFFPPNSSQTILMGKTDSEGNVNFPYLISDYIRFIVTSDGTDVYQDTSESQYFTSTYLYVKYIYIGEPIETFDDWQFYKISHSCKMTGVTNNTTNLTTSWIRCDFATSDGKMYNFSLVACPNNATATVNCNNWTGSACLNITLFDNCYNYTSTLSSSGSLFITASGIGYYALLINKPDANFTNDGVTIDDFLISIETGPLHYQYWDMPFEIKWLFYPLILVIVLATGTNPMLMLIALGAVYTIGNVLMLDSNDSFGLSELAYIGLIVAGYMVVVRVIRSEL